MNCIRFRPRLLRREHLQVLVEAMDVVQNQLDDPRVRAAATRFFGRPFAHEQMLAEYLQDLDAHSQFYPWLLWDAGISTARLGGELVQQSGTTVRGELVQTLIDTPPDVYIVLRCTPHSTTLQRVTDGAMIGLDEAVLHAVLTPNELLIARVLDLGDCHLLDAVHACLPTSARRGMVRAARKAAGLTMEKRLPLLMAAAQRAMSRSLRAGRRLTAPGGEPILRATAVFTLGDSAAVHEQLADATKRGQLSRRSGMTWRVVSAEFGHVGATLRLLGDRLLASTSSLKHTDALAEHLLRQLPNMERRLSVLQDLDGLMHDDGMSPVEVQRLAQEWLDEFLTSFEDTPQHSLGGITPRQAMSTPRGRSRVRTILRSVRRFSDVAGAKVPVAVDTIWAGLER